MMEFLTSNKWKRESSSAGSAVAVIDENLSNQMDPLPCLNQSRSESEGNRKRSHQRAFDPVIALSSTDNSFSSAFLMDSTDSALKVSSQTSSDKRLQITEGNKQYVRICFDDEGVSSEQHGNLSNDTVIQGICVSNMEETYCIATSSSKTDVSLSLHETGKQMSNSECDRKVLKQQEHSPNHAIDSNQVRHNLNEMDIIEASSNASIAFTLNSTPPCSKKQRKRKHTEMELKIQLISLHQAPVYETHSRSQVMNLPYPCREFTDEIDPRSLHNHVTDQRGTRELNAEKFFASKANLNKKIKIAHDESHLYESRQPSVLCKPSLGQRGRDHVSPLAEGYKLQDGVYKITCVKDKNSVKKSHYNEEPIKRPSVSKKSKTIPLIQQQNFVCLASYNANIQLARPSSTYSINETDNNIENPTSTTEISHEKGGVRLNDRTLQSTSCPSSSWTSSSVPILNEESFHKGFQKALEKTRSLKSDEIPSKSNQNVKATKNSRDSERWTDIENLSQRIENMSTLDLLDQRTAFDNNEHTYDSDKDIQSKSKCTIASKEFQMDPPVSLERLNTVISDMPLKLSSINELDQDGDPFNNSFPLQSKQRRGDEESANWNNSSSDRINTNFNTGDTAAHNTTKAVTIKDAVTGLSFKEVMTRSAIILENTSTYGCSEKTCIPEKLESEFVSKPNIVTTTKEKAMVSDNVNIQKTSDITMFKSQHIITAVILSKDTNSDDTVCPSGSTDLTLETKNKQFNIPSSSLHGLASSDTNKQSYTKTTHMIAHMTKRKNKTAYVPIPLTPDIYRYLVENAGVVIKPFIPPAGRNGPNQIIKTFRTNENHESNPLESKCNIPTKTITALKLTKSADIISGNIANNSQLVCTNTDDHSYTRSSVCSKSNVLTTLKYSPLSTHSIPFVENDGCNKVQQKQNRCVSAGTSLKLENDKSTYLPRHSKLSTLSSDVDKTSFTETVLNNTVENQEGQIKKASRLYLGNDEIKVVSISPESFMPKVQTFFSSIKVQVEPYALKCGERMFLITLPGLTSNQRAAAGLTYEHVSIPQPFPESDLNGSKRARDEFTNEQVLKPQQTLPATALSKVKSVTDKSKNTKRKQGKKNIDKNITRKNNHTLKMVQKMTVVLPKYPGKMDKFVNALVLRSTERTTITNEKPLKKKSATNLCSVPDGVKNLFTLKNLNLSERKHATAMMTVSCKDEFQCQSTPSVVKIVQIFKESEKECRFYMQYISINLTPGPSHGYHRWFQYSDYPCRIYFHFKVKDEITHIDIESSRSGFYIVSGARTDNFPRGNSSINAILSPYPPCLHNLPDGSMAIAIGKLVLIKDLPEGVAEKKSKCLTTSSGIINVLEMVLDKENFKDLFNLHESRYNTDFSKNLSPKVVASRFYGPELFDHFTPRRLRHRYTNRKVKQQANMNCSI